MCNKNWDGWIQGLGCSSFENNQYELCVWMNCPGKATINHNTTLYFQGQTFSNNIGFRFYITLIGAGYINSNACTSVATWTIATARWSDCIRLSTHTVPQSLLLIHSLPLPSQLHFLSFSQSSSRTVGILGFLSQPGDLMNPYLTTLWPHLNPNPMYVLMFHIQFK